MSSQSSSVRIGCLILRASLAVVFLYHGLDKLLSPGSAWGTNWAAGFQQRESQPPPRTLEKLQHLPTRAWLTTEESAKLQDDVAKADAAEAERLQQEADSLAAQRLRETADRLHHAYALESAPSLPTFSFAVQYAVTWGEIIGGVALLLGILTRLAAAGMIVIQLGAIYFVTGPLGLTRGVGVGYEYNLCLIAMCLCLVIMGAGGWSIDHFLRWGRRTPAKQAEQQAQPPQPVASAN